MIRPLTIALVAAALAGCTIPTYEADPVSVYQWEKRQERIQQQEAERLRRCETMDKQSERYARECASTGARQ
jgi:hypothetical protein